MLANIIAKEALPMRESLTSRVVLLGALTFTLVPVGLGAGVIAGAGEWDSTSERTVFGTLWMIAGLAMASGLLLSKASPRPGLVLVALGAVGIAMLWFWAPFITIPIGVALIWLARQRGKGLGWPRSPGDAA